MQDERNYAANDKIREIAERIRWMRELLDIGTDEMCALLKLTSAEYAEYEAGQRDFSFSLLYEIALKFQIDITELITGELPKLSQFSLIRDGQGLPIERRKGFLYQHMAYLFKNRNAEPFRVVARYDEAQENKPIPLSAHAGQEFDYILSGTLRMQIEEHVMELAPGDAVYYDAGKRHGMIATGGGDCVFLAVISNAKDERGENE